MTKRYNDKTIYSNEFDGTINPGQLWRAKEYGKFEHRYFSSDNNDDEY
jgi:hypothetical protein